MSKVRVLTLQQLLDANACTEQVQLFREHFGESVIVTVAKAKKFASMFDFFFAARTFLSKQGWAEYEKQRAPLLAEYLKQSDTLSAEYQKQRDTLWAEYEKQRGTLLAEYEKQHAPLWAEYVKQRAVMFTTIYLSEG